MFRLNVPYSQKDQAKAAGAKWNYTEKFWFYPGEELPPELSRWFAGGEADTSGNILSYEAGASHDIDNGTIDGMCLSVTQLNQMIKNKYNSIEEFRTVLVKGEVTNYSGTNGGHFYFAVKDEQSLINVVMWAQDAHRGLNFKLEKGQQVAIAGSLEYASNFGKTSLYARQIVNIGQGAANLAYLKLKEKLRAEGLFDEEYKKPIPKHPKKVAIITSRDGKAIGDIIRVANGRDPYVEKYIYHVNVQGKNSVETIVNGIALVDRMGFDVIIIARGGGSDEELKSYDNEKVVRAAFNAVTPIVSAVGHDAHVPLIDYVVDLRAATPSNAAELVFPDVMTDIRRLEQLSAEIKRRMNDLLNHRMLLLNAKLETLKRFNPEENLKRRQDRLNNLSELMRNNMYKVYERDKYRFGVLLERLHGLSPTAKLINGFGYISHDGKPVVSVDNLSPGDELLITLRDGEINAEVVDTVKKTTE